MGLLSSIFGSSSNSNTAGGGTGGTAEGGQGGQGGQGGNSIATSGDASAAGGEATAMGGNIDFGGQVIAPSTHISINTDALAMAIERSSADQTNAFKSIAEYQNRAALFGAQSQNDAAIKSAQIQAAALVTSAQSASNSKALEAKTKGAQMQFFSNIFTDTKKGLTVAAVGLLALYLFKK